MRVLYSYVEGSKPIYVDESNGAQRVILVLKSDLDTYVYYVDDYYRKSYINKILSTSLMGFTLKNFIKIESDEEFNFVNDWIHNNYNYDGSHIKEKVDGEDLGGI